MGGMNKRYDHIVVGAGSAGSVLAARLSEDRHRSVLLLEAGGDYPALERMPDSLKYAYGTGTTLWDSGHMWSFRARATDQACIDIPRGRVAGGSSAVNDAQFLRGMPEDFDRWAEWGNPEWRFEKVFPYLLKLEADQDISNEFHGSDGPIQMPQVPARRMGASTACLLPGMSGRRVPRLSRPQSTRLHRRRASRLQHRRPCAGEYGNWLPEPRPQSGGG